MNVVQSDLKYIINENYRCPDLIGVGCVLNGGLRHDKHQRQIIRSLAFESLVQPTPAAGHQRTGQSFETTCARQLLHPSRSTCAGHPLNASPPSAVSIVMICILQTVMYFANLPYLFSTKFTILFYSTASINQPSTYYQDMPFIQLLGSF